LAWHVTLTASVAVGSPVVWFTVVFLCQMLKLWTGAETNKHKD